jgi:hypothetical protein
MVEPTPFPITPRFPPEQEVSKDESLKSGNGGGTFGGMEGRLLALEAHVTHIQSDLGEIKESLKVLPTLPTRHDLDTWRWQWIAAGIAIVASIIGGLGWLETRANRMEPPAAPAPIVIQVPASAPAPSPTVPNGARH